MRITASRIPILLLVLAPCALACKRSDAPGQRETGTAAPPAETAPAFSVSSVDLGKAIGPDKRVSAATTTFRPRDTIYASVTTTGTAPRAVLVARWTYEDGQVVKTDSQTIAPQGPATTEFHMSKPSGWPVGKYKVEITADGQPASTKEFEVKK